MNSLKYFVLLASLACCALACRPVFRMYETRGYGNEYVENAYEWTALEDEFHTVQKGITGSRTKTCPVGVWMGYSVLGFHGMTTIYADKDGSVSKCRESTIDYKASIKIIGDKNNYRTSAVVTYRDRYNEGIEFTYFNNTAELTDTVFGALIIVGNQEVELFTESNFQGPSYCLGPNNGPFWFRNDYDARNHLRNGTELITNMADLNSIFMRREFHSFRFGCSEK